MAHILTVGHRLAAVAKLFWELQVQQKDTREDQKPVKGGT